MKVASRTWSVLQAAPLSSSLLGYNDTVCAVVSEGQEAEALHYLPLGAHILGSKADVEYTRVEAVHCVCRVVGSVPALCDATTLDYLASSIAQARQLLEHSVLISKSNVYQPSAPLTLKQDTTLTLSTDLSATSGTAPTVHCNEKPAVLRYIELDVVLLPGQIPADILTAQFNTLIADSSYTPHHFSPPGLALPLTLTNAACSKERARVHELFNLPNIALLKPAQAMRFGCDTDRELRLLTPHCAVTGVKSSFVSAVCGGYAYHHYMQDKFNDSGWGCAYRSLQTLCSWFLHNGYTDKAAPSHQQIQQTLVDMGDKPAKFVNSKQWIGSVEVSWVLERYLGVSSRIQFVSSGEEMSMQGGMLQHHFQSQGTPVMIGGGVLAHTILGVKYDDITGDTQFLILDPHYTGKDTLETVVKDGWCGWKKCSFWDQTAHYNMCLPQRPEGI